MYLLFDINFIVFVPRKLEAIKVFPDRFQSVTDSNMYFLLIFNLLQITSDPKIFKS